MGGTEWVGLKQTTLPLYLLIKMPRYTCGWGGIGVFKIKLQVVLLLLLVLVLLLLN